MPTAIPKNLETLSFKQLTALQTQIEDLKTKRHDQAVSELKSAEARAMDAMRQKLAKMAAELGVKPETVPLVSNAQNGQGKTRKGVKAKARIAPKYMNPLNKDETWTGRGRAPRWLAAKLKGGATLEQYRIGA